MRCLPPLVAGLHPWVLPMADASAAGLAELLVSGDGAEQRRRLTQWLGDDPPLLVWVACRAGQADQPPCRSIAELAAWLATRAVEVLQWPAAEYPPADKLDSCEVWGQRVAAAVAAAGQAATAAGPDDPSARDMAVLSAFLRCAEPWRPSVAFTLPALPPQAAQGGGLSRVSSVVSGGDAENGTVPFPNDDACRLHGDKVANRWMREIPGPADWLPPLAAQRARLAALETRFAETLQEEKLTALAEFAAGAGHEINNPLTVIAGRAQLFLHEETDPERRRALALINSQAMRVYEMIADLRLFARPPQPELQPVALVELVDRLVVELGPAAAQQGISLCRLGDPGPIEIVADPTQLLVALRALCQNAIEALGTQGHITIALQHGSRGVEICVADDGPGISPAEQPHVFDPFYSARQAGRGLGLGLSKCWRIITNHGGRIHLESPPGHGARFTIALPK